MPKKEEAVEEEETPVVAVTEVNELQEAETSDAIEETLVVTAAMAESEPQVRESPKADEWGGSLWISRGRRLIRNRRRDTGGNIGKCRLGARS
jgi:hypothetical protein